MDSPRQKVTIAKPILIGSYAFPLKQEEIVLNQNKHDNSTHRWVFLIRSPTQEDISYYIKKVVITLHSSFLNQQRICESCPYEVMEAGWGEFEITAKIFFVDTKEKPVELKHWLKLYPTNDSTTTVIKINDNESCVVSEHYDEILFVNPSEYFYDVLMTGPINPPVKYSMEPYFLTVKTKNDFNSQLELVRVLINKDIEKASKKAFDIGLKVEKLKELYYACNEDLALNTLKKENWLLEFPFKSYDD